MSVDTEIGIFNVFYVSVSDVIYEEYVDCIELLLISCQLFVSSCSPQVLDVVLGLDSTHP